MAMNIKNDTVERLVREVATLAGETKTQAIRTALEERKQRLALPASAETRRERLRSYLDRHVWPQIPRSELGRRMTKAARERLLGYGSHGV